MVVSSNKFIILKSNPDTNIISGLPYAHYSYSGCRYSAVKNVNIDEIDDEYKNLIGKKIKLATVQGKIVDGEIVAIKMLSESIPHFGNVQAWSGEYSDYVYTDEEINNEVWNLGEKYLVAEFKIDEELDDENEIVFAAFEDNQSKAYFTNYDADDILVDRVHNELSGNELFKSFQQEYAGYESYAGDNWWESEESWIQRASFETDNNETYVSVLSTAGNPCGCDFYFYVYSITKFNEDGTSEILFAENEEYYLVLAIDVEGDGILEFILDDFYGTRVLLKLIDNEWKIYKEWSIPYLDCPC